MNCAKDGKAWCWKIKDSGCKMYNKIVIAECNPKDDRQLFRVETVSWEHGCSLEYKIRPKCNEQMVVAVTEDRENPGSGEPGRHAWLRLEYESEEDEKTQIWFADEHGKVGMGGPKGPYPVPGDCMLELFIEPVEWLNTSNPFADCNNVVTQGMSIKKNKPVMLKKFREIVHFWKHSADFLFDWEFVNREYCCDVYECS